jgi:hypothetical protein
MRYDKVLLKIRIYNLKENRGVFDKNSAFNWGGYEFDCYLEPGYYKFRVVFPSLIIRHIGYHLNILHDSPIPRHAEIIIICNSLLRYRS